MSGLLVVALRLEGRVAPLVVLHDRVRRRRHRSPSLIGQSCLRGVVLRRVVIHRLCADVAVPVRGHLGVVAVGLRGGEVVRDVVDRVVRDHGGRKCSVSTGGRKNFGCHVIRRKNYLKNSVHVMI